MAKYINKAALVAEIEKKKERVISQTPFAKGVRYGFEEAIDAVNAIEVKEVDLEKEMNEVLMHLTDKDMRGWFRYFFELGIRASQSTVPVYGIEEALKENGIDPDSKEADMYREAIYKIYDRLKAQKG